MSDRVKLFKVGCPMPTPIHCRACGRKFARWQGTANHALVHVAKDEATAENDPHCPSTSGARYNFYLNVPHA